MSCPTRRSPQAAAWPSVLLLALAACGPDYKKLAEESLGKADRFVAGAQTNGGKIMPEAAKALADSLAAAKALAGAGNYKDANNKAVEVANAAITMARSLGARRTQIEENYKAISASIAPAAKLVTSKLRAGQRPKSLTPASFDSLSKASADWGGSWKAASDAYAAGEIAQAGAKADALKNQVLAAMAMLGIKQ